MSLAKPPFVVTRQFTDSGDAPVVGSIYLTEIGGNSPVAYTRGGLNVSDAMIRGTPVALDVDGAMTVTVYDQDGVRLTAYDKDNKTILYQEDYNPLALIETADFRQGVPV